MKNTVWYNVDNMKKAFVTDGKDCRRAAPADYRMEAKVIAADRLGMSYIQE